MSKNIRDILEEEAAKHKGDYIRRADPFNNVDGVYTSDGQFLFYVPQNLPVEFVDDFIAAYHQGVELGKSLGSFETKQEIRRVLRFIVD